MCPMDDAVTSCPLADEKGCHILFIGFMGAGKSTVARRLGRMFDRRVVDLDRLIERRAGKSVPLIFTSEGEEGFRYREHAALESMSDEVPCIISCGGGVVTREDNIALLQRLGTVVYLEVDPEEAVHRISHPETRPLLNGSVSPRDVCRSRLPFYREAADVTVDTDGKSIDEVVNEVGETLWRKGLL